MVREPGLHSRNIIDQFRLHRNLRAERRCFRRCSAPDFDGKIRSLPSGEPAVEYSHVLDAHVSQDDRQPIASRRVFARNDNRVIHVKSVFRRELVENTTVAEHPFGWRLEVVGVDVKAARNMSLQIRRVLAAPTNFHEIDPGGVFESLRQLPLQK